MYIIFLISLPENPEAKKGFVDESFCAVHVDKKVSSYHWKWFMFMFMVIEQN